MAAEQAEADVQALAVIPVGMTQFRPDEIALDLPFPVVGGGKGFGAFEGGIES
jgi:hypothetical protein